MSYSFQLLWMSIAIFSTSIALSQGKFSYCIMTSSNANIFLRYWPFVRGIHRSPIDSPHKYQWRGTLVFSLICTWINGSVNNREAGDLRRHRAYHDVTVINTCGAGTGISPGSLNLVDALYKRWLNIWNTQRITTPLYAEGYQII